MYDKNNYEENAKKRVKRAKVLCKVRDVPESYYNMSTLFNLINLNTILALPALHTVILRPVNSLEKSLMEACISLTQGNDGNPLLN